MRILSSLPIVALLLLLQCAGDDDAKPYGYEELYCDLDASTETTTDGTASSSAAGAAGASGAGGAPVDIDECEAGHPCEPIPESERPYHLPPNLGRCREICLDSACGPAAECREDACFRPDHCGRTIPCPSSGDMCDVLADRCYPRNGACGGTVGCPQLRGVAAKVATSSCDEKAKTCEVLPNAEPVSWLSSGPTRDFEISLADNATLPEADLEFSWAATRSGVILRILDRVPLGPSDWVEGARWRAARAMGAANRIRFSEGEIRQGNRWRPAAGHTLEPGRYYFIVAAIDSAGTVAVVGDPFDFTVGETVPPLPGPGDGCASNGQCFHPDRLQLCIDGSCEALCATHADCEGIGTCGDFAAGRRVCTG